MNASVSTSHSALEESSLYDGFCKGQSQLTEIFAHAEHLGPAVEPSLSTIGSALGWACVQLWTQEPDGSLSLLDSWSPLGSEGLAFQRASWASSFGPGEGAPGGALANRRAVWVADVTQNHGFSRSKAAAADGIGSLLEIPMEIRADDEPSVFHIMEFAAPGPAKVNAELLEMTQTLCSQIAQFATMRQYAHLIEQDQPIALREEIVDPLELAFSALETGDVEHASSLIHHTIIAAKRLAGPNPT